METIEKDVTSANIRKTTNTQDRASAAKKHKLRMKAIMLLDG